MAAFGQKQGGKASAHESKPKQGHTSTRTEAPDGCKCEPIIAPGHGGTRKGFGK